MKFTVGKLVWGTSILIFLGFAYGQSTFLRVYDIFTGEKSSETIVQKFVPETQEETVFEAADIGDNDNVDSTFDGGAGIGLSDVLSKTIEESDFELNTAMEIELLKYRIQELKENYNELKADMKTTHSEKDDSMDNILAIITTLLPIALPYFTRKSHNKEITFKKEVKV